MSNTDETKVFNENENNNNENEIKGENLYTENSNDEITADEQAPEEQEKKNSGWKKATYVAGGVVAGAGAFAGINALHAENSDNAGEITPTPNHGTFHVTGDVKVADSVNDDMTFNQAFAAARKQVGANGVFEWHGKLYNTFYKNEWDNMSEADKQAYFAKVNGTHVPHTSDNHNTVDDTHQDIAHDVTHGDNHGTVVSISGENHHIIINHNAEEDPMVVYNGQTIETDDHNGLADVSEDIYPENDFNANDTLAYDTSDDCSFDVNTDGGDLMI
ncbi:MAG: hypothetical protein IJ213_00900 [Bacteroidales bacterium]|nr:hypothetical protein [Bacteroidales bacterium]